MARVELRKNGSSLKGLTDRQRKFCAEYPVDLNAKEAAIRAGYSPRTAAQAAQKLLNKPQIKAYLGKVTRQDLERLEIDRTLVLQKLYEALTWRVDDLVKDDGSPRLPNELGDHVQSQVDGVEWEVQDVLSPEGEVVGRRTKVKYKMTPRATAREQALKHKGLMEPERVDHRHHHTIDWAKLQADSRESIVDVQSQELLEEE